MLRSNLATRPFYNIRAVRAVLGLAAGAVLALVLYDVIQLVNLTVSQRSLGARAAEAEAQATRIRAEAERTRRQIDPQELQTVANAAREANAIIDRRAFSWTALFERFEATLPSDVRITAVQPNLGEGGMTRLRIAVEARRAEDLDAFVEAMENSGAFRDALAIQEVTNGDGLIDATIETTYVAQSESGAGAAAPDARQASPTEGQL